MLIPSNRKKMRRLKENIQTKWDLFLEWELTFTKDKQKKYNKFLLFRFNLKFQLFKENVIIFNNTAVSQLLDELK